MGDRLAGRIAGEIGEDIRTFASPKGLQCYAGTAPATRRSGKRDPVVAKRRAYNRYLGDAAHQWAFCSLSRSAWVREFYDSKIAAGKSCHAALRALSTRWLEVLWHCLARGVSYDEALHQANRGRSLTRATWATRDPGVPPRRAPGDLRAPCIHHARPAGITVALPPGGVGALRLKACWS